MKLSRKIILITVSSFIALVSIVATTSDIILLRSYARLEQDVLQNTLKKVKNEIEETFSELVASQKDYADKIEHNVLSQFSEIDAESLVNHRVDFVALFNSNGVIKDIFSGDFHNRTVRKPDEALRKRITEVSKSCVKQVKLCKVTGYLTSGSSMFQIAVRPVDGDNLLMVGRSIDKDEVTRIGALTKLSVDFHPLDSSEENDEYDAAERFLLAGNKFYSQILPNSDIAGYSLFHGIDGKPALILRVSEQRVLFQQGKLSIGYVLVTLTVCSALLCIITLFFLRSTVLKRLSRIIDKVGEITRSGNISDRLDVEGDDELGELSVSINSMLDSLASSEYALKESEERYRLLFERAPDAIMIMGIDGEEELKIIAANQAAADQHGYSIEEMCSLKITDLNTAETNQIAPAMVEDILKGEWITQEAWHRKKDGSEFPIEIHAGLLKIGGRRYLLGFDRDITARKLAEESGRMYLEKINTLNGELAKQAANLEAVNRELESFNYSVSHDMRGPLTHISGYCQLLLEDDSGVNEQTRTYIDRIYNSTCWLDQLIDAMFELSKFSKVSLDYQQIDLSGMVTEVINELHLAEPQRDIETIVQPGIMITGDPGLIKIVITNLVNNSWKYSAHKPKTVIEFGMRKENGAPLYFLRDQGAGFDMNKAGKLFRVFSRLHDESRFAGTGIGLATVQRIIMRHGGRIWGEGIPEAGATFFFSLKPVMHSTLE